MPLDLELLLPADEQFCTNSSISCVFRDAGQEGAGDVLIHLSLSVAQLTGLGCPDWRYGWMITGVHSFSWLLIPVLQKISRVVAKLVVLLQRRKHLLEVEVVGERRRLGSWICRKTSQVKSLGYLKGLARATAEALGTSLQQLDGIQPLGSCLRHGRLVYREDLCLSSSVVPLEPLVDGRDYGLVKYLTSAPLHTMQATSFIHHFGLYSPKGFWHKLFDLFGLVNAETKGGSLARAIREHPYARTLHWTR